MRRFLFRCLAVLAMSSGSVALAGLGPNGLGPNGLGPNGLGPNGLGPNGLGPNGLGPNGLGPNGLGPNGLGPNGLGPNGLGPNGLDVNGLGPNGLGPNGLGPNGLPVQFFAVEPGYVLPRSTTAPSSFDTWFQADPAAASKFMSYFVRCAYDGNTGIAYLDAGGKTWAWTGQYGLAMTSLKTTIDHPTLGTIRAPMTRRRGQVGLGLPARPREPSGKPPVHLAAREPAQRRGPVRPHARDERDLGDGRLQVRRLLRRPLRRLRRERERDGVPRREVRLQPVRRQPLVRKSDTVIGRNCDVEDCFYPDPANPAGPPIPVLNHVGSCGFMEPRRPVAGPLEPVLLRARLRHLQRGRSLVLVPGRRHARRHRP